MLFLKSLFNRWVDKSFLSCYFYHEVSLFIYLPLSQRGAISAHAVHTNNKENSPHSTSSLNYVLLHHCITSKQDYYSEDLTSFPKVSLRTMNFINNHMWSCKIPTKKMARKNLMHSLPGAGGLQRQEQLTWWATTCNMGDRKRHQ